MHICAANKVVGWGRIETGILVIPNELTEGLREESIPSNEDLYHTLMLE